PPTTRTLRALTVVLVFCSVMVHLPAPLITKRSVSGPVINQDFPDPSLLWVASENKCSSSPDFITWTVENDSPPPTPQRTVSAPRPSKTIRGPYTPLQATIACPISQGGAIDPAGHHHPDGSIYVVYKIDGNSLGHGGSCNNGVAPIVSTPIMLQKMAADGVTPVGSPVQILDRDAGRRTARRGAEPHQRERGCFFLFFSSGCYADTSYDLSYATATSVTGPYTKARAPTGPLLVTGKYGLRAPGSATFAKDGSKVVFHAGATVTL
ncbi:putative endo-arabinase, partial [Mycena olivaceomarginata]